MHICATARLSIRTAKLSDAAFYLALVNSPSFIAHLGDRGIRTLEQADTALAEGPLHMQASFGHSLYVVEAEGESGPVGMCGLIRRPELDGVDLGYAFLPDYQGRGFATEAGRAVVAHAHGALGIERLLAIVSPDNQGSRAVLHKLGFEFAQVLHLKGGAAETLLYQHGAPARG